MYSNFNNQFRYSQPYQQMAYQQPVIDNNIMQQQPIIPQVQQIQNNLNYDFFGSFVKSYDEVKNNPLNCEKPLVLLDVNNEKLYIKQMDNKGNPIISAFSITQLKEENMSFSPKETDSSKLEKEIEDMKGKISELEKMINKTTKNTKEDK